MARSALPTISSEGGGLARYLQEIRQFPMLQPDEEYMLAKRWKEHGDREAAHKLVTSHDAFPYYAKAYGFTIVGFAQPEPGKDPSPAELAELVRTIKGAGVKAIFSEVGVSSSLAQTLGKEAGVTKIVDDLPTDSVVAPPADTYIGVVRTVTQKIVDALR